MFHTYIEFFQIATALGTIRRQKVNSNLCILSLSLLHTQYSKQKQLYICSLTVEDASIRRCCYLSLRYWRFFCL
jgi:hypothetical protein